MFVTWQPVFVDWQHGFVSSIESKAGAGGGPIQELRGCHLLRADLFLGSLCLFIGSLCVFIGSLCLSLCSLYLSIDSVGLFPVSAAKWTLEVGR